MHICENHVAVFNLKKGLSVGRSLGQFYVVFILCVCLLSLMIERGRSPFSTFVLSALNLYINKLQVTLQNQGYPKWLVNSSITEALKIPKQQLRKEREQKEDQKQILCFVATYNSRNPDIYEIIKNTLNILHASPKIKKGNAECPAHQ